MDIFHDLLETISLREEIIKNQNKTINRLIDKNLEQENTIKVAMMEQNE